jgi:phosphoglycolate phosphatase
MLKALLFDLDGTLLDSLTDIAAAMNRMLAARGLPACDTDDIRRMVGDGMRQLVVRALPEERRDEATVDACLAAYRSHYETLWKTATRPYDGIPELLEELRRQGFKLGVISNKAHRFTLPMTGHFFGSDGFEVVLGQRDEVPRKPDPAAALEAAARLGVTPAECAYVGDSGIDMELAANSGMTGIGVTWGLRDAAELRAAGATHLVDTPAQVLALCTSPS